MPPSLQNHARSPNTSPVGTYDADFFTWYTNSGLRPVAASPARMAVMEFPPAPLPQEPKMMSPAISGELTLRLSNACSYSQSTLPVSGATAEMPCDWLLKINAGAPPFGS